MTIVDRVQEMMSVAREYRERGLRVALVPTMGYLHEGHVAHLRTVRPHTDIVVVSIFVNPAQFSPSEDLSSYPRDGDRDARVLTAEGCDVLFAPMQDEIYPAGYATSVDVRGLTERYEGAFRPTHFRGVTTVVAKLLNIVRPHLVTFGMKDAQQVAVVRRMMLDLNCDCDLLVIDTVREPDGLAMSSRNVYLSEEERGVAASIPRALMSARQVRQGGGTVEQALAALRATLSPGIAVDYADIVDPEEFVPLRHGSGRGLAIVAGRIGRARLIDNMVV